MSKLYHLPSIPTWPRISPTTSSPRRYSRAMDGGVLDRWRTTKSSYRRPARQRGHPQSVGNNAHQDSRFQPWWQWYQAYQTLLPSFASIQAFVHHHNNRSLDHCQRARGGRTSNPESVLPCARRCNPQCRPCHWRCDCSGWRKTGQSCEKGFKIAKTNAGRASKLQQVSSIRDQIAKNRNWERCLRGQNPIQPGRDV